MTEAFNRNATILTLDNEQAIRESFLLYLEDYGLVVIGAENGRVGIRLFDERPPAALRPGVDRGGMVIDNLVDTVGKINAFRVIGCVTSIDELLTRRYDTAGDPSGA